MKTLLIIVVVALAFIIIEFAITAFAKTTKDILTLAYADTNIIK